MAKPRHDDLTAPQIPARVCPALWAHARLTDTPAAQYAAWGKAPERGVFGRRKRMQRAQARGHQLRERLQALSAESDRLDKAIEDTDQLGRRVQNNVLVGLLIAQALGWLGFLALPRTPKQLWWTPGLLLVILAALVTVRLARSTARLWVLAIAAANTLLLVLLDFSRLYWSYGTPRDWNMRLSHLDALVVAIGTLSTAGTAGMQPQSELARGILGGQMVLDTVIVAVVVGVVVSRLIERPARRAQLPQA